jgi:hypothetical protein
MPSRNPTTRCSLRAPKLKEAETSEGSSPGTARQLEYTPREEPVIKPQQRNPFSNLQSSVIQKQAPDPN